MGAWMSQGGRRHDVTSQRRIPGLDFPIGPHQLVESLPFPEVRVHTKVPPATETSWMGRGEGVRNQAQEKVKEEVECNNLPFQNKSLLKHLLF